MQKRTKMVHLSWKQCLLVTNIATFFVGVVVALKTDNACFFWSDTPDCSQHHLQCDHGTIFLTQAVRGFKLANSSCHAGNALCVNKTTCCGNATGQDCLETYTQAEFSNLARECWNRQSCNHTVQNAQRTSCNWPYTNPSGYSEVQYICLDGSAIHDFGDSSQLRASSLALRYLSSHGWGYQVCRVTAEDCTRRTSSVLLTRWPNTIDRYCSSLRVNTEHWLPCSTSVTYETYTLTTPFRVWLLVRHDEVIDQAWAVINSDDSSNLRVECKPGTPDDSFQNCTPTTPTMTPASLSSTSQRTDSTAFPSSHSTGTSGSTTAGVLSSAIPSLASGPGSDVTKGAVPQSAGNTGNTAAVVGGVVAVVVLVVVAVVVAVILVRRRNPTTNPFAKIATWFKGGNSNRSHGNSGRPAMHVMYAQPTSLPVYDNSAAAITDEAGVHVDADSDYNYLGQKPTSSASRDVTYGHLAVGSEVTDYGYDRVSKGKPAVRSGDVINNIYNTAGPPTAGSCDDDAYNVTGAAKNRAEVINNVYNTAGPATGGSSDEDFYNTTVRANNRPDVINNVYNTPSPATEASPDVDYYNTAGVPQTGPDVINNDYDIPKSARTPGPGETEAHDVTGDDGGFPYELARNVK